MKIVHVSTSINASSANTRLHIALQKAGVESEILVLKNNAEEENICEIKRSWKEIGKNKCQNRYGRLKLKQYEIENNMPFSVSLAGTDISSAKSIRNADVIHLHWICNFLSPKMIRKLIDTGKPVVWTCHDSWPFTGGCHVRYGCQKYQHACGCCPMLHSDRRRDITYKTLQNKEKYLAGCPIIFIAPSNWIKYHITHSSLFGGNPCHVIPNTIDTAVFREWNADEIQNILGYAKDDTKLHILFGATDIDIPYKGFGYLVEVLEKLRAGHGETAEKIVLHIVGAGSCHNKVPSGYEYVCWGQMNDPAGMSALYSLADVLLYPSVDDNLPNMVMESLACATPVVSFDTGGIPDMVVHKENGYIARYKDSQDLTNGLLWVLKNNRGNRLGRSGRLKVKREFGEEVIAKKHIRLYQSMTK